MLPRAARSGDVSLDPDVRWRGAKSCLVLVVATDRRHDLDRLPPLPMDRFEHARFRMRDCPEARDDQRSITLTELAADAAPSAPAGSHTG